MRSPLGMPTYIRIKGLISARQKHHPIFPVRTCLQRHVKPFISAVSHILRLVRLPGEYHNTRTIISDNGFQFCAKLSQAVYQLLGVHKLSRRSYHQDGNGGVERMNHTMAQMLAMVANDG